MNKPKQMME